MRAFKSLYLVIFALLWLTACATKVTSIRKDVAVNLKPDEGYLMLTVDTSLDLIKITISGTKDIELTKADLKRGSNHILITLPAGNYHFDQIYFHSLWGVSYIKLKKGHWDFHTRANQISYVGQLQIKRSFWNDYGQSKLVNNSSQALEYLETNFSNILTDHQLTYQGPGQDRFFDIVRGGPTNAQ